MMYFLRWLSYYEIGLVSLFGTIGPGCDSVVHIEIADVYRLGPEDSSTPAIALYGEKTGLQFTVVEKIAEAYLNYTSVDRACTYGTSEWTLFSEPNFEGNSTCLRHSNEMDCSTSDRIPQSLGSVIRGCNLSKATIAKMKSLYT